MQQIEAAIGQDKRFACGTPFGGTLPQLLAAEDFFSNDFLPALNAVLSRVETVRWHVTTLAATRLQYPASLLRFLRHSSPSGQLLRCWHQPPKPQGRLRLLYL